MRTLVQQLKVIEDEPLDFSQIQTILAHRCDNLHVTYTDLESLKNKYELSDILPTKSNGALILLTARLSSRVNRHWVTLLRHKNGNLSFYDPLRIGPHVLSSYMNDGGYFARYIKKIKADVNTQKHQRNAEMIKTCGLHASSRLVALATQDLTNSEYHHWITSVNMSPDLAVSFLCYIGHLTV